LSQISVKSAKAKGRPRTCRRCREDYTPSIPLQKVCDSCRKNCSGCGIELNEENQDSRGLKNKTQFRCKACVAEGVRSTPGRKEWQKNYDLKRHYNLTLDEYKAMSLNGCEICSSKKRLVVDHCHSSGEVRGILCSTCNTGLGMFQDNKEILRKAYGYISEKC
jgi:hypothetical protein